MKYITVLDFEVGKVFQYEWPGINYKHQFDLSQNIVCKKCENTDKEQQKQSSLRAKHCAWISGNCEEYLSEFGHNLSNCEWMVHDSNEIITN